MVGIRKCPTREQLPIGTCSFSSDIKNSADLSTCLQFGAGARTCLGRNISLLEMSKVIPQIYREFELLPSEKQAYSKATNWFVKPNFEMKVCLRAGGTEE